MPLTLQQYALNIFENFNSIAPDSSPCTLIGWSLGGCISLILSHFFPKKIKQIILVNTAAKFEEDLFSESAKLRSELLEKNDYLKTLFNNTSNNLLDYLSAGCSLDILKHYYTELHNFNMSDILHTIPVDTKIIHGLKDPVISSNEINILKAIKQSEIQIFENEGHFIPLTSPYHFNKLIASFLVAKHQQVASAQFETHI